jgi:hypothetical protein
VRREGTKGIASGAAGVVGEAKSGGEGGEVEVCGLGFLSGEEVGEDDHPLGVESLEYGGEIGRGEVDGGVFEGGCEGGLGVEGK